MLSTQNKATPERPARQRLPDFAGRLFTLSDDPRSWECLSGNAGKSSRSDILLLGLGPANPMVLPFVKSCLSTGGKIYWLDEPDKLASCANHLCGNWVRTDPLEAIKLAPSCTTYFYRPGMRINPDFWGGLLAQIDLAGETPLPKANSRCKSVWLPGNSRQLVHQELHEAFTNMGFSRILENLPLAATACGLQSIWRNAPPDLALSVNFRGLDSEGRIFRLCEAMDVPLAVWLVDNPWHLLSGIKFPWWRDANIFVTDASFVAPLREQGAKNVWFLPLATSSHMWLPARYETPRAKPLFVGRSEFPEKAAFFGAAHVDRQLEDEANSLLETRTSRECLPDYHWWSARCPGSVWPGFACRTPGLGAENISARNKLHWLRIALKTGLIIIGDKGWETVLPDAIIKPPVDYYGKLPILYNNSSAVLNVTGLLLPQSLNQRHFDVWAAGGLLLSDDTKGLQIFPHRLVKEITLRKPEDFAEKLEWFKNHADSRKELICEWQSHLRAAHSYEHRLSQICTLLGHAEMAEL